MAQAFKFHQVHSPPLGVRDFPSREDKVPAHEFTITFTDKTNVSYQRLTMQKKGKRNSDVAWWEADWSAQECAKFMNILFQVGCGDTFNPNTVLSFHGNYAESSRISRFNLMDSKDTLIQSSATS